MCQRRSKVRTVARERPKQPPKRIAPLTHDQTRPGRPFKRPRQLDDLLRQVSATNRHGEVQTGAARGEEAW